LDKGWGKLIPGHKYNHLGSGGPARSSIVRRLYREL
jgi:hypothetical protein